MLQTLLLNFTYEPISFISERKVCKFLANDKVEIISFWDEMIFWSSGNILHPSILRLKNNVRFIPTGLRFNRDNLFKRDLNTCQYCSIKLYPSILTVDHIIPRTKGGENSWLNCVTACRSCNNKKGKKFLYETNMILIKNPIVPKRSIYTEFYFINNKHPDWNNYISH